jgi:hypothetical protein
MFSGRRRQHIRRMGKTIENKAQVKEPLGSTLSVE